MGLRNLSLHMLDSPRFSHSMVLLQLYEDKVVVFCGAPVPLYTSLKTLEPTFKVLARGGAHWDFVLCWVPNACCSKYGLVSLISQRQGNKSLRSKASPLMASGLHSWEGLRLGVISRAPSGDMASPGSSETPSHSVFPPHLSTHTQTTHSVHRF